MRELEDKSARQRMTGLIRNAIIPYVIHKHFAECRTHKYLACGSVYINFDD